MLFPIENNRDNLITELKNLSADIVERIDRTNKQKSNFKLVDHLQKVKELALLKRHAVV